MARNINNFKLLVMFLYGRYPFLTRLGDGILELRTGPCAHFLHSHAATLRDEIRWLQKHNYISGAEFSVGCVRFKLVKPAMLEEIFDEQL